MSQTLFNQPLNVINVGIAMFSDDLKKQNVPVTQLDWTPPGEQHAGGSGTGRHCRFTVGRQNRGR